MKLKIIKKLTKNSARRLAKVKYIVCHHTGTDSVNSTIDWFMSKTSQRSAHFVIDKDGTIYQMVELERAAWHCKGNNQNSVGIEIVSKDSPLTVEQEDSLFYLIQDLMSAFSIKREAVSGHRYMEGASTECPGNLFADYGDVFGWVKHRFKEEFNV